MGQRLEWTSDRHHADVADAGEHGYYILQREHGLHEPPAYEVWWYPPGQDGPVVIDAVDPRWPTKPRAKRAAQAHFDSLCLLSGGAP